MMRQRVAWWTLALVLLAGGPARADDKEDPFAPYVKAGMPGPQHKALEPLIGEWTYTAKFWIKPGAEPLMLSGRATRKMILGGRFLRDEIQNEKPAADFKGIGLTGYDNLRKKYTAAWVDSMSSGIMTSTGTASKDGKVFTFVGENIDPADGKTYKNRDVIRILGKDKHVTESYKGVGGKEVKVMEITYVRKKSK